MSRPLKATPDQLSEIASALRDLTRIRHEHGVEIGDGCGPIEIKHVEADVVLELAWDEDKAAYRIDDRNGS